MSNLELTDAICQVEQAQAVLSLWLESTTNKTDPDLPRLISSIMTLLHGVPEAMDEAEMRIVSVSGDNNLIKDFTKE
ncbi:hypothetical protein [Klebsiella quasipneumoniae]|uniref:hypothetical protein n=1 Tax=Klebsiella quasipneumoniae TaxID=1463165 RepID=UPI00352BB7BA